MMSEIVKVGMADFNICKAPNVITTLGLVPASDLFYTIRSLRPAAWCIYASGQYEGEK